jgi:hypothetical protein
MKPKIRRPRALLSASIGVAAVTYLACSSNNDVVANLMAPPPVEAGARDAENGSFLDVVANLVAPPPDDANGIDDGDGHPEAAVDASAEVTADAAADAKVDGAVDAAGDGTVARDAGQTFFDVVANLVFIPPDAR